MKLSGLYTWYTQPLEPSVGGGPSKQDGEVAPLATQLQVCMRTLPTPLAQHLGMLTPGPSASQLAAQREHEERTVHLMAACIARHVGDERHRVDVRRACGTPHRRVAATRH